MHEITVTVYAATEAHIDCYRKAMSLTCVPRTGEFIAYRLANGLGTTEQVTEVVHHEHGQIEITCGMIRLDDGRYSLLDTTADLDDIQSDMLAAGWTHASRRANAHHSNHHPSE